MRLTPAMQALRRGSVLAGALLLAGCGPSGPSGSSLSASEFPSTCLGPLLRNESLYGKAEVEPSIAVDPADPTHLITVWQQDRYSRGGSAGVLTGISFDSGNTWASTSAAFSHCTGGNLSNGGDYERASDPWVTIAPDGTAHQAALAFDVSLGGGHRAVLASRSTDRGRTWSAPQTLQGDTDPFFALDKGSITADPQLASNVYAVWDRLTMQTVANSPLAHGPAWFARSTNAGVSWEPAQSIYDPGADSQTIGNVVAVLPDGTLLNAMLVFTGLSTSNTTAAIAVLRSTDHGVTWPGPPITVSAVQNVGVVDLKSRKGVRTGGALPSIAVDASTGKVYVAWEDSRFAGVRNGIAISTSIDGGLHWSAPPIQGNRVPTTTAFTPAISAGGGQISVAHYDFRADNPSDGSQLLASSWLVTSANDGATWQETALAGPFNLYTAAFAQGYFLGDYQGLSWDGTAFVSFFAASTSGSLSDPSTLLFRRVAPGASPVHALLDAIRPDRLLGIFRHPTQVGVRRAPARTAR